MRIWTILALAVAAVGAFVAAPSQASPLAAAGANAVEAGPLVERTGYYGAYYNRPFVTRHVYARRVYYGRPAYYRRPVVVRRSYARPVYYGRPVYYRRPVVRRTYRSVYYPRPAYYPRPVYRTRTVCRNRIRYVRTPYGPVRRSVRTCTRR